MSGAVSPTPEEAAAATVRDGLLDSSNALVPGTITDRQSLGVAALDVLVAALRDARSRNVALCVRVEEVDRKAQRVTDHPDGAEWVGSYYIKCGPWHRLLGLARNPVGGIRALTEAEGERDQARDALQRIEANALAWHGPEGLDSGHARALAVIATWCRAALGGAAEESG